MSAMDEDDSRRSVYCGGRLLDFIQRARIFPDSKTFVDMSLNCDPDAVLAAFERLINESKGDPSKQALQMFVQEHFTGPGNELEIWTPNDWVERPAFLSLIQNPNMADWAREINHLWKILGRKMKQEVKDNPERHSLLYVPNPFIVPGDRFREFYYWDTYWIVKGLLLCEMQQTVRGILGNFFHIVDTIGFVPNGGRIYYTNRSHPPLLLPMTDAYYEASKDINFVSDNLVSLEKEYSFWVRERTVQVEHEGKTYKLSHYNSSNRHPRPEGYIEDSILLDGLAKEEAVELCSNVAAACESGWDFSTRWFEGQHLKSIKTKTIIPVDLNSYLFWNEMILSKFHGILGNQEKKILYESLARERQVGIDAVLWNDDEGVWFDYDLTRRQHNRNFFPSNMFPLYVGIYDCSNDNNKDAKTFKIMDYLKRMGVLDYPGGVPTSLVDSGQQWDFPNAWPPLIDLLIESLDKIGQPEASQIAFNMAQTWIKSVYQGWTQTAHMYEKYSVLCPGKPGGGGEYQVQTGFGWTNGMVLSLLYKYRNRL